MLAVHIPNPLPKDVLGLHFSWIHPAGRLIWSIVLLLIGVGVIGEYLGRTYMESKRRPPFIIRKVFTSKSE